jgi:hypothetical protein
MRRKSVTVSPGQAAPLTARPTPERIRQAAGVTAPDISAASLKPWWGVSDRLDRWRATTVIDEPMLQAARDVQRDLNRIAGMAGSPLARLGLPRAQHSPAEAEHVGMVHRVAAAARLRRLEQWLGVFDYDMLVLLLRDEPMARLARRWGGCDPTTARNRSVALLERLAVLR